MEGIRLASVNERNPDITSTIGEAEFASQMAAIKNRHAIAQRHGSGSLAGVHPDSLAPASVTIPRQAAHVRSLSEMAAFLKNIK